MVSNVLEILDCQTCGACCFSRSDRYVRVHGEDYARLGDLAESLVHWIGNQAYMRMANGRCGALVLENGRFACSIYASRPQACRDLDRGSPACEADRWQKLADARDARRIR